LFKRLNAQVGELLDRRAIPFPNVIEAVDPERGGSQAPYLQVQFGHGSFTQPLAATLKEALAEGASGFLLPQMEGGAQVNLQVFDTPEGTVGMVVFDPGQIRVETAASLESSYLAMLDALARDPETHPGDLDLASPAPSSPCWERGDPEPVHQRARRLAVAHPARVAVRDGAVSLDNATLWARVDALAAQLAAFGGGSGDLVATLLPRSADLLVAQLAILESGLAVMPLDMATPPGRVAEILADARPLAVITRDGPADLEGIPTLSVGTEAASGPAVRATSVRAVALDDPAFVLHTSGSTGRPKGVVFPHGALSSRLLDLCRRLDVGPGDRVLNYISPAFDPSVQETLMAVTTGATLVVSAEGEGFDPGAVARLMVREQVTHGVGVPSMLREVVTHPDYMGCRSLRGVTCGGETLTPALRDRLVTTSGARLFNVYGATETTICATVWDATDQPPHRVGAVGYPMDDTVVRVLDPQGRPLPPGVIGEIAIGGPALALGYRNRPEETAARYRADPFSSDGGRLYWTGDGGWLDGEGLLWFTGRLDGQVKINGQRVEPGEVEARLRAVPGIKEVVVEPRSRETGEGLELVAYVVAAPRAEPSVGRLHGALVETMPPALRPVAYCWLEALPLTRNGKVDRAKLPVPRESDRLGVGAFGSPSQEGGDGGDSLERAVASIWSEALGGVPVPLDANFFSMGGHSLLALRIVTRIETELGRRIPANSLYAAPTVREFVSLLRRGTGEDGTALGPGSGPHHRELRSGGEAPPLVLIAPGMRGKVAFERLARVLPPGRSIHCLIPPTPDDRPAIADMADLVAFYADQVARLVDSAPVHLLGYSIGGLPAHDLARILEERGSSVLSLTLVDSLGPRWTWLGRLALEIMHARPRLFDGLSRWTGDRRFGELADDRHLLNMLRLARAHSVSRWPGRMTFVGRSRGAWMVRLGAREWLSGTDTVDWVTLRGDHSSLFQEPGVGDLATLLNEVMCGAEECWLELRTKKRTDHEGK
jgi:amino acid adenylation domain-containing protein